MTFALCNFTTDKNEFTWNFVRLQSNTKEFVKKYRNITQPSPTTTPSASQSNQVLVTVEEPEEAMRTPVPALEKTPAKKNAQRKRQSASQTPEGAELLSPEKLSKPNTLDETIEAHFTGKSPFYLIK